MGRTGYTLAQRREDERATAAQVQRDIASGVRCGKCWLLKPCNPDGELCGSSPVLRARARVDNGGAESRAWRTPS